MEKTYLGDICESIKEVVYSKGLYLSIKISEEAVSNLNLNINIEHIRDKIVESSSSKYRLSVDNVVIKAEWKLQVKVEEQKAFNSETNNLLFVIQQVKRMLPGVIIKGIPSVSRAVC